MITYYVFRKLTVNTRYVLTDVNVVKYSMCNFIKYRKHGYYIFKTSLFE